MKHKTVIINIERNTLQETKGRLSGAQLKAIAMASMLADHLNKAVIYRYLDGGGVFFGRL